LSKQPFTELSSEVIGFRATSDLSQSIKKLKKKNFEALGLVETCQQKSTNRWRITSL